LCVTACFVAYCTTTRLDRRGYTETGKLVALSVPLCVRRTSVDRRARRRWQRAPSPQDLFSLQTTTLIKDDDIYERGFRLWTMDDYMQKLDQIGESILQWADPDNQFRGYTEVRHVRARFLKREVLHLSVPNNWSL
jgi:hypothetical protein